MFLLRVLSNFNFILFKYIYNNIYSEDIYEDTSLIEIYIIIINSLLTTLAKIITTLINIFYLILFKTFFFKINIKKIVNSSYIVFSNISI